MKQCCLCIVNSRHFPGDFLVIKFKQFFLMWKFFSYLVMQCCNRICITVNLFQHCLKHFTGNESSSVGSNYYFSQNNHVSAVVTEWKLEEPGYTAQIILLAPLSHVYNAVAAKHCWTLANVPTPYSHCSLTVLRSLEAESCRTQSSKGKPKQQIGLS